MASSQGTTKPAAKKRRVEVPNYMKETKAKLGKAKGGYSAAVTVAAAGRRSAEDDEEERFARAFGDEEPGVNNVSTATDRSSASARSVSSASRSTARPTASAASAASARPALTRPVSPKFASESRKRKASVLLTSEEAEAQRVALEVAELKKRKERAAKAALSTSAVIVAKPVSARPLTEPVEFHFATSSRTRTHPMATRSSVKKVGTGRRTAAGPVGATAPRAKAPADRFVPSALTNPVPFSFATETRVRSRAPSEASSQAGSPFRSFAEATAAFQRKTPKRFHTSTPGAGPSTAGPKWEPKLTVAKGFDFAAEARHRPSRFLTREQEEELAIISAPKFHARPVDPKILASCGDLGVPKVPKAPVTTPRDVHFASEDRIRERHARQESVEAGRAPEVFEFKAAPFVKTKTPKRKPAARKATVAKTPKLRVKERAAASRRPAAAVPEPVAPVPFKAAPVPVVEAVAVRPSTKPLTQPQPFSFEESQRRVAERIAQEKERLAEEERKKREFKARPVRIASPMKIDLGAPKVTQPQPFQLRTDARGNEYQQAFHAHVDSEMQEMEQNKSFHAHPVPRAVHEPFFPQKSSKPLTEIANVELASDVRASQRAAFDRARSDKERARAEAEEEARKAREAEEAQEIKRLRSQLVHKAQPVHRGNGIAIKKSEAPLTEAKTPKLATRTRASVRV